MTFLGTLTEAQQRIVVAPSDQARRLFVRGPAGAGKTTALQRRLVSLLEERVPSYTILTLLAEQDAADGFRSAVAEAAVGAHSDLHLTTFFGLAREMVALYWPLVAGPAGFAEPNKSPVFMSYDLAQIQMRQVIQSMLAQGAFDGLALRPQQILSQLLDNLNRTALNRLTLDEMEMRLVDTWTGAAQHTRYFRQAADAARRFRQRCLETNSLDLSLVIALLCDHLLVQPAVVDHLTKRYRHLLVDNVEELSPAGIAFLQVLLPGRDSAVVVFDKGAGYKRYLAADPDKAASLAEFCDESVDMPVSMTTTPSLEALANTVHQHLVGPAGLSHAGATADGILQVLNPRFRREMIRDVAALITEMVAAQVCAPSEIAVIAPYLDGALCYALTKELASAGVPYRLLRRRSDPRDDALVRGWLTLCMLAHPQWGIAPSLYDVSEALAMVVAGLDRPRAALASRRLYDPAEALLSPTRILTEGEVARIGRRTVEQIGALQRWMDQWPGTEPLDRFLGSLFSGLLSAAPFQPKGRPHRPLRQAAVCDWLIRAAYSFRQAAPALGLTVAEDQGKVFVESILEGLVSGTPLTESSSEPQPAVGVSVATLYAYLLAGPPVQIQVWLDVGATGWWETPRQPLSNAFVLSPSWDPDRPWTEADSYAMRNLLLARLVRGLCSRCGRGVVVASSQLDRRGERQDGPLWRALGPLVDEG